MADDLGARNDEVHAAAKSVLDFWFGLAPDRHFAKDEALDREITKRFGAMRERVLASQAAGWRDQPESLLAAVILLDQFSRNIHRGGAAAFAADDLASSLTLRAIEMGWEQHYSPEQRAFLYMPLMHAEDGPLQRLSVEKFEALGAPDKLKFARDHADVIASYGRFPSRNAALDRPSTRAEENYLSTPGAGW